MIMKVGLSTDNLSLVAEMNLTAYHAVNSHNDAVAVAIVD